MTQDKINVVIHEDIITIINDLGDRLTKLSGKTLLVTGGSGFLCSYFIDTVFTLNSKGLNPPCKVISMDNYKVGRRDRFNYLESNPNIEFLQHDVTQPIDLDVDYIIHGASIASPTFYRRYPLETIDANVTGTRLMLEMARNKHVQGILYLSTSEIYGDPDPDHIPTNEEYRGNVSCTGPRACYDESKRLAETLCMNYYQLYNVPVKVVRPFNFYGPGQWLADGRIIPDLMTAAISHKPIVLYSNGLATRAFCYISDAIRAMWHLLLSDVSGEAFNVGNDQEEVTILQVAELLRKISGPPLLDITQRVSEDAQYLTDNPQRRCPDLTKIRRQFNWAPSVSLSDGLARTLRSYLE
jgi:UDP-glucuronate decarboxylase